MFWISAQIVDSQGKTTARRPGMSQDDSEKTIRAEMLREAVHQQGLIAEGIVRPAVNQINIDHYFEERDFLAIVVNNPFVPNSRAMLYARGLCAGLRGDMLVSTHLLIPQVENSIRYILQNNGFITSGLDDDQIQDEYSLQRILYTYGQALEKLLGEDLLFDLQGLLVERFGSNLRNLIAHGLINGQHFVNRQTVYLWWLALRLCCLPVYIRFQQQDDSEVNRAPDETAEASH